MSSPRRSPAAPPLDDGDLLSEILLRLPPLPSSLPRASAVCKRWRLLVSDPRFLRRFRIHHRRSPPLLGCFQGNLVSLRPALEPPNRVPPERFSFQPDRDSMFVSLGCRHGLVLVSDKTDHRFVVWDPVTGHQHQLAIPPGGIDPRTTQIHGAVLPSPGDLHFQVVLVGSRDGRALACVYSSETGLWGDFVSTPIPTEPGSWAEHVLMLFGTRFSREPAVLVDGSLYWTFGRYEEFYSILEFDLRKQSLAVIGVPVDASEDARNFMVIRADAGGLGFFLLSNFTAQLWERNTSSDGAASWVLGRTIELDKLLSLNSEVRGNIMIQGYAEENNAVFLWASTGVYEVQLKSLQSKELPEFRADITSHYHAFESVYTAETDIGGEHDGAELLHNA